mgnify:CR=1 FL=1
MEAKLPVSALLHSATMVAAGAYLLIRMLPLFTLEGPVLQIIAWLGILTALICSVLASLETHPKKVLAYSTSANFGLMFFAIGILNVKAALIFLIAHAFIKSMLFLSIDENENFINYITFLLGGLSLSGLIFSGVIAKEFLFVSINNTFFSIIYCVTAFLTAFYIMRISLVMVQDKRLVNRINLATNRINFSIKYSILFLNPGQGFLQNCRAFLGRACRLGCCLFSVYKKSAYKV